LPASKASISAGRNGAEAGMLKTLGLIRTPFSWQSLNFLNGLQTNGGGRTQGLTTSIERGKPLRSSHAVFIPH
jgi:hypothetical protein